MNDPVPELQKLLGPAVFIAWPKGVKGNPQKWGHLRLANMTPEYLAKLQLGNIGVALGEVSGGLCAIDWDKSEFVGPFLEANPELRDTLQTHGARGRVFWVRFKGDYPRHSSKLKIAGGVEVGEFRSNGNQSIVWGIHPKGIEYHFVVKQSVVTIDFSKIRWLTEILNAPALQRDRVDRDTDVITLSALSTPSAPSALSLCLSVKSLEQAVEISLPEKAHQNNYCLFKLARAIKAFEIRNVPLNLDQKKQVFSSWYEKAMARGALRKEQSRDQYLVEFLNAYKRAKIPLGQSPAEEAMARAITEHFPAEANVFDSKEGKLLVALCYQLNRISNGESWFLACHTAANLIGTTPPTASKWLNALVELGILEVTAAHTSNKARRYRYVRSSN